MRPKYADEVVLIGETDRGQPKHDLVERMRCAGLASPTDAQVKQFLNAPHAPTPMLFERLHEVLRGDSAFVLVGAQQEAQLHLLGKVREALRGESRHMLVVTGGPGTGKTLVAARLVADIPRLFDRPDRPCRARYLTPS
jgi:transcriptional regulator with AAA-type ATPase domain